MAAPLNVDREQVRMLVLAVGCREAARQLGLKEATVMQWSARGKWLAKVRNPEHPTLPKSMQPVSVSGVSKPVDVLTEILSEDNRETRISLSRAARRMAKQAEDAPLTAAKHVESVAKTSALVHGWSDGSAGVSVNLLFTQA